MTLSRSKRTQISSLIHVPNIGHESSQRNKRMAFTGAGISAESGVPTYRDPGGLWEFYNPEEVSSIKGFGLDPRKVWAFEVEFYKLLRKVVYNPGHKALADLE